MKDIIKKAGPDDIDEWLRMRRILWEHCPDHEQIREIDEIRKSGSCPNFVAQLVG